MLRGRSDGGFGVWTICPLRVESSKPERRERVGSFITGFFIFLFLFFLQIDTFSSRRDGLKLRVVTGWVRVVAQALLAFSCLWSPSLQVRRPCKRARCLLRSLAAFYPTSMATALRLAGSLDTPRHGGPLPRNTEEQSQKLSSTAGCSDIEQVALLSRTWRVRYQVASAGVFSSRIRSAYYPVWVNITAKGCQKV
jgi:hypothetical protein